MNTARKSNIAVFLVAVLMAAAVNGGVLMSFDKVARDDAASNALRPVATVALPTVTIVGHQS